MVVFCSLDSEGWTFHRAAQLNHWSSLFPCYCGAIPFPVELIAYCSTPPAGPLEEGLSQWELENRPLLFVSWEAKATSPLSGTGICLGGAGDVQPCVGHLISRKTRCICLSKRKHTLSLRIISHIISIVFYLAKLR